MAKTGDIGATGTGTGVVQSVMGDQTPEMTLGAAVAASLAGSSDELQVVIDLAARTAKVFGPAVNATNNDDAIGIFTQDDPTKKVTGWTGSGANEPLNDVANVTSKPARSMASLVSAIEDMVATSPALAGAVIAVDQLGERVKVYSPGTTVADVFIPDAPPPLLATVTQTIAQSDGTVRNAFE